MSRNLVAVSIIGLSAMHLSCAPIKGSSGESSTASTSKALPIVGTWIAESYNGYFYDPQKKRVNEKLDRENLRTSDWKMISKIDSDGTGYITTRIECLAKPSKASPQMSGIRVPAGFDLFPDALKLKSCDAGKEVRSEETRIVMGIRRNSLPANLGLDGKKDSLLRECDKLRGLRFIQTQTSYNYLKLAVAGSMGCIGFADSLATKLTLLVVPLNEVHAIKVDFSRFQ